MSSIEEKLGAHGAKIEMIDIRTSEMDVKLDAIALLLAEKKGERKALAVLAGVLGTVGGLISGFFHK